MMKKPLLYIAAILTLATALGGCMGTSQPPRFYTLTPISEGMTTTVTENSTGNATIGIGPVKLADYLDQSRIVTRSHGNRVVRAEFDQWSGSLKNNFTNVLAENISYLLASDRVVIYPWRSYMPVDYQVTVDIMRFDGHPGKEVTLVAHWSVMCTDEKKLFAMKRSDIRAAAGSNGYKDLVAAQSKVMGSLSRAIAEAIQAIARSTN